MEQPLSIAGSSAPSETTTSAAPVVPVAGSTDVAPGVNEPAEGEHKKEPYKSFK